jgi:hypothetical protein
MPAGIEVGDDRLDGPVPIAVDDVAAIAVAKQVDVEARINGPRQRVRPDADRLRARSALVGGQDRPRSVRVYALR